MVRRQITGLTRVLHYLKVLFGIVCLSLLCFATPAKGQAYRPNELIVSVRVGGNINALARLYGFVPVERLEGTDIWRVRAVGSLLDILRRVQADPTVEFAELNYILATPESEQESMAFLDSGAPPFIDRESPPRYYGQPAYAKLMIGPAQDFTTGQGVIVAVVDTGIDASHPALMNRTRPGRDFVDNDFDPTDEPGGVGYGHGTFVSGLIVLVAPDAQILPLRALDPSGRGDVFTVAKAIRYGANGGAQVINLSVGLARRARVVDTQIAYAVRRGAAVVASAGNQNSGAPQYPAASPDAMGVAALDNDDIKAAFSNYNERISVSAPGVEVYSTFPDSHFAAWSGTSFAAAFVSGEAALVRALYPQESVATVRAIIQQSAEDIYPMNPDYVGRLGSGRINCFLATQ